MGFTIQSDTSRFLGRTSKKAPCMCSETDFTQEKGHFYPTARITIPLAAALSQNGRRVV